MSIAPYLHAVARFLHQLRLNRSVCAQAVVLVFFGGAGGQILLGGFSSDPWRRPPALALAVVLVLAASQRGRVGSIKRKWRLVRSMWPLPGLIGKHVILRYPSELESTVDLPALLTAADQEFKRLNKCFRAASPLGFTLVLLPPHVVHWIYGAPAGGFALAPSIAVVATGFSHHTHESICHEFTHLFAARCLGRWNCPLLNEGLAMWLQGTNFGIPVETLAVGPSWRRDLRLGALLDRRHFFDQRRVTDSYLVAGSFTGFLIRRLTWRGFRRFCGWTFVLGYRRSIKRMLGMSLEEAEARWRAELQLTALLRGRLQETD